MAPIGSETHVSHGKPRPRQTKASMERPSVWWCLHNFLPFSADPITRANLTLTFQFCSLKSTFRTIWIIWTHIAYNTFTSLISLIESNHAIYSFSHSFIHSFIDSFIHSSVFTHCIYFPNCMDFCLKTKKKFCFNWSVQRKFLWSLSCQPCVPLTHFCKLPIHIKYAKYIYICARAPLPHHDYRGWAFVAVKCKSYPLWWFQRSGSSSLLLVQ